MKKFIFPILVFVFISFESIAQSYTYPSETYEQGSGLGNFINAVWLPPFFPNNITGASSFPYYASFSNNSGFNLQTNSNYSVDITTGTNTGFAKYAVFIDFNANGILTDAGETIMPATLSNASGHLIANFTIPSYVTAWTLCRMRIICTSSAETITVGGTYQYGETEDYLFYAEPSSGGWDCTAGTVLSAWNNNIGNYIQNSNYGNNENCVWLIHPTGASQIDLNFEFFGTQANADFVKVYDGQNTSGTLLGSFSGTNLPPSVTASSGYMYVVFTSNSSVTNIGFQANYHCYNPSNCTTDINPFCNNLSTNITKALIYNTTLNNTSTCNGSNFNYTSYPATGSTTATLNAGGSYIFDVYVNQSTAKAGAWFDFNHNDTFETTEFFNFGTVQGGTIGGAVGLNVPFTAVNGLTKMRIRSRNSSYNITGSDACTTFESGETEDYLVTVSNGAVTPPNAAFSSSSTNISIGGSVNFLDQSTNAPTGWQWTFAGATPSSSSQQNPSNIVYNSAGCYAVTLVATNSFGSNTETQTCFINVSGSGTSGCEQLFFSEYLEGSGNNKAIEIYNPTTSTINLSGYSILSFANGSATATATYNLTGEIASNDVYVVANGSATAEVLAIADATNNICQFNGNDAMALAFNGNVIDVIGEIGVNPGTFWTVGSGSTLDNTLVRNASVSEPTASWATSQTQWTSSAINTFSNLGVHTSDCYTTVGNQKGIENEKAFLVYPNPAKDVLHIALFTGKKKLENDLKIIDVLGKQARVEYEKSNDINIIDLNIQHLSKGIYFIKLGEEFIKFIKE